MKTILKKEMKLSASPLAYFFIAFGLMAFLPGYPILCGAFFLTLGLFQSFQYAGEANDTLFSVLLPIAKKDVVRGRYLFASMVEFAGLLLMAAAVLVRMTVLRDAAAYRNNVLMNANPFFLGMACLIFGIFNTVFIGGFYKTGYKTLKPFLLYSVAVFLVIGAGEALHHVPGLESVNAFGFDDLPLQLGLLVAGAAAGILLTILSCRISETRFEKIDL